MIWQRLTDILICGLLIYSMVLIFFYLFIGVFSIIETRKHLHRSKFSDPRVLATSPDAPGISVIAPAYNEAGTIIDNVRSLLSIYYEKLEIIIVNDGSRDDSLKKLIDFYHLVQVPFFIHEELKTKKVRGIYKSTTKAFRKLTVIDKENGGKADSLNAGINVASHELVVSIDVDCILEQDALLKIVMPFLDKSTAPVICSGSVIRIANSCLVENGKLIKVNLPEETLPRMQT
ncbi:MAG: glycosyltransferase, partial [Candidatus Saccharimonadales bacterium]